MNPRLLGGGFAVRTSQSAGIAGERPTSAAPKKYRSTRPPISTRRLRASYASRCASLSTRRRAATGMTTIPNAGRGDKTIHGEVSGGQRLTLFSHVAV